MDRYSGRAPLGLVLLDRVGGNAIRKIRIDLGVPIEQVGRWRIGVGDAGEPRMSALFRIRYDLTSGGFAGHGNLLYIKPLRHPDAAGLPLDVLQYTGRSADFPHESTANQFFTESQFESYRALGEYELDTITGNAARVGSVAELIELASGYLSDLRPAAPVLA